MHSLTTPLVTTSLPRPAQSGIQASRSASSQGLARPLLADQVHFGAQTSAPAAATSARKNMESAHPLFEGLHAFGRSIAAIPRLLTSLVQSTASKLKFLSNLHIFKRLHNALDNMLGFPRHGKFIKAGTWGGATLAIGLIPPFHALIAAAPVTFMTTLLVDMLVGFWEGLSGDPQVVRAALEVQRQKANGLTT